MLGASKSLFYNINILWLLSKSQLPEGICHITKFWTAPLVSFLHNWVCKCPSCSSCSNTPDCHKNDIVRILNWWVQTTVVCIRDQTRIVAYHDMLLTRSAPWYIVWQSSSTYASLGPKPIVYGPWTVSALCLERFRCFVYYLPTISRTLYCRLGTQQLQHQSKLSSWYFHWSVKDLVSSMLVFPLSIFCCWFRSCAKNV